MDSFLSSLSLVALAEIGDKTQLLSLLLAARYKRPVPIILGILIATTLNHALAAYFGHFLHGMLGGFMLQMAIALMFIFLGLWILLPDSFEMKEGEESPRSAFLASLIAFFLAEMGDKTQLATVALGAHYSDMAMVVLGTTAGMLAANIPAVLLGERILRVVPVKYVRYTASILFVGFGIWQAVTLFLSPA